MQLAANQPVGVEQNAKEQFFLCDETFKSQLFFSSFARVDNDVGSDGGGGGAEGGAEVARGVKGEPKE